jgi:hypothetical protein
MKSTFKFIIIAAMISLFCITLTGCDNIPTADQKMNQVQEQVSAQAVNAVGFPAITNFSEKKTMKRVLELRDQANLITYSYVSNAQPTIVRGKTALGGKFTYLGTSIGYPIPYATQYTSPSKLANEEYYNASNIPQADPNGLFSPASANGTWVTLINPETKQQEVDYIEENVATFGHKLPSD